MTIRPSKRPSALTKKRVKELRANATEPEKKLWSALRGRKAAGLKFRRQHPIEPYIVDFYCMAACLVIELDGDSHDNSLEYDLVRAAYLRGLGLEMVRVSNEDALQNLEGVVEFIVKIAFESPKLKTLP